MEQGLEAGAIQTAAQRRSIGGIAFQFLLHLAIIYVLAKFVVAWIAGIIYGVILPHIGMPSNDSRFGFSFNHILLCSVLCGFLSGVLLARYNQGAAWLVWIVPAGILAYRFATFPSTLFENHFAVAFHHYFAGGFLIPEFHSYREMFQGWNSELARGIDQLLFAAPVYVGVAYGAAGWTCARLGIRPPGLEALFAAGLPFDLRRSRDIQADSEGENGTTSPAETPSSHPVSPP
jgi:hypothetical protein